MDLEEVHKSLSHGRPIHHTLSSDPKGRGGKHTPRKVRLPRKRERYEEDAHIQSWKKNPMSTRILDTCIPKSLENPLKIQCYNKNRDLDEHVEHVNG